MAHDSQRDELLAAVLEMDRLGLVSGTSGNASVRISVPSEPDAFLVTPAALPYPTMTPNQLVPVNGDLRPTEGDGVPSSESLLHLAIYRARPDVNAVMHTHSVYATALGVAGRPLPPIVDELVVYVGGQVEVAEYGFPGTQELAQAGVDALGDRRAVLIPHHGMFAVADSLAEALRVCALVERVAQVFINAEAIGGARVVPSDSFAAERKMYLKRAGLE
jgi:L-ribulose-5-phosphate 4-epimerase